MTVIEKYLPNFCTSGRELESINGVILHYFSARNVDKSNEFDLNACYNLFLDLNRSQQYRARYMQDKPWPKNRLYASAHFLIARDCVIVGGEGKVLQLVDVDQQAYHAGASILNGRDHCNEWTLGIELIGHQHSGFTYEQYQSLAHLLVDLQREHNFPRENIAGHDTVRHNARLQWPNLKAKYDPSGRKDGNGDNFNWEKLFAMMDGIEYTRQGVKHGMA